MSISSALRIRHEHNIPVKVDAFNPKDGFTIEGWVKPAPVDRVMRIYDQQNYGGRVIRIKPGAYRDLSANHLEKVNSICLPPGIEAVFFSEANYKGNAYAVRDEQHIVPPEHQQAGSVVVLDRFHRRQSHAVLFEQPNHQGRAQLLHVAETWDREHSNAKSDIDGTVSFGEDHRGKRRVIVTPKTGKPVEYFIPKSKHLIVALGDAVHAGDELTGSPNLDKAGSAWIPPGVQFRVTHTKKAGKSMDHRSTCDTWLQYRAHGTQKASPLSIEHKELLPTKPLGALTDADTLTVPDNERLIVFSEPEFQGKFRVIQGTQPLGELPWWPQSGIRYKSSEKSPLIEGIVIVKNRQEVYMVGPGNETPLLGKGKLEIWVPPGFNVYKTDDRQSELKTGFNTNVMDYNKRYRVEKPGLTTIEGDSANFPSGAVKVTALRIPHRIGDAMTYNDGETQELTAAWPNNPPSFKQVDVPHKHALFLFERANCGGRCEIVIGRRDDLSGLEWTPRAAVFAKTPAGTDGILSVSESSSVDIAVYNTANPVRVAEGESLNLHIPPGYHFVAVGGCVERFAGILTNRKWGLKIVRQPGRFRREGEKLQFGGQPLRPDRWVHLALTSDGQTLRYFMDGRQVSHTENVPPTFGGPWLLGEQLRGTLARVRLWSQSLSEKQIKAVRFLKKDEIEPAVFAGEDEKLPPEPPRDLLAQSLTNNSAPPDAVVVAVDDQLPKPPGGTILTRKLLQRAQVENQKKTLVARQHARHRIAGAHKRAQYKLARAHEQARRDIHLHGIHKMAFLRGGKLLDSYQLDQTSFAFDYLFNWQYNNKLNGDVALDRVTNRIFLTAMDTYAVPSAAQGLIECQNFNERETWVNLLKTDSAPVALAVVQAKDHPLTTLPDSAQVRTGLFWIDQKGGIYSTWAGAVSEDRKNAPRNWVRGMCVPWADQALEVPSGRPHEWDLVVGPVTIKKDGSDKRLIITRLYWTNGWEIYEGTDKHKVAFENGNVKVENGHAVSLYHEFEYRVLVPHAVSPHPIALAVSPKGDLVWLDAQDGIIRKLSFEALRLAPESIPSVDLYRAYNAGQGITICDLPTSDEKEKAFVYWVSGEDRTLELPVLDTPGRYLDLHDDHSAVKPGYRPMDAVQVESTVGVEWTTQPSVADARTSVLSFQDAADHLAISPMRLDLNQGWTATVELKWQKPDQGSTTPVCIYEMATYEDENRLVCALEKTRFGWLPCLFLHWGGKMLTQNRWTARPTHQSLEQGQRTRMTWCYDPAGMITTYLNGQEVTRSMVECKLLDSVFEVHRLGAPNDAQYHRLVDGAMMPHTFFAGNEAQRVEFTGFTGMIARFSAWNSFLPAAAKGFADLPQADPTWDHSLVTVHSRHRYLRAGRLDGNESPITLFPVEMDGGLCVESKLDHQHAELTEAHIQLQAAREFAAFQKQAAHDKAQEQWNEQHENYLVASEKSQQDMARTSRDADIKQEQAGKTRKAADNKAAQARAKGSGDDQRIRSDGENDAVQIKREATDDKARRVGNAESRLAGKRRERDSKQSEYERRHR